MKNSRSVVRMLEITGAISSRSPVLNRYDIQGLFRRRRALQDYCDEESIFPEGMNVEELKRMRSMNASLNDVGYDRIVEKFLKNIVSRRTFNFFKNE